MTLEKAGDLFGKFHKRDPDLIVPINIEIPRFVYPIGYCPQISYKSDKWDHEEDWQNYIHWWENPTIICVPEQQLFEFEPLIDDQREVDLGPNRGEVTFLGHPVDFHVTEDDRSSIDVGQATMFVRNRNPEHPGEVNRLKDSFVLDFDSSPERSKDYLVCSPSGRIVYVIADSGKELYCFINQKCVVTPHGIEG